MLDRGAPAGVRPFDLVHAHTGFPDGELAASAAERLGIPYIVTEHSSRARELLQDPDVRRRYASVVQGAAKVVVVSEALGAELRAALPDLAVVLAQRLMVVPNTVPVELFRAPPRGDRRVGELLYVGSRKVGKGLATLARGLRPGAAPAGRSDAEADRPGPDGRRGGGLDDTGRRARRGRCCRRSSRRWTGPGWRRRWLGPTCSSTRAGTRRSAWWQRRRWRLGCPWSPLAREALRGSSARTSRTSVPLWTWTTRQRWQRRS